MSHLKVFSLPSCKRNCFPFLPHPTPLVIAHLSCMSILTEWLPLLGWLVDGKPQAAKRTIALLSLHVQASERGLPYLPGSCFSTSWDVLREAGLLCTYHVYVLLGYLVMKGQGSSSRL